VPIFWEPAILARVVFLDSNVLRPPVVGLCSGEIRVSVVVAALCLEGGDHSVLFRQLPRERCVYGGEDVEQVLIYCGCHVQDYEGIHCLCV
jgi:hypothetical protein